jgi:hypothetical protein
MKMGSQVQHNMDLGTMSRYHAYRVGNTSEMMRGGFVGEIETIAVVRVAIQEQIVGPGNDEGSPGNCKILALQIRWIEYDDFGSLAMHHRSRIPANQPLLNHLIFSTHCIIVPDHLQPFHRHPSPEKLDAGPSTTE